MFAVGEEPPRLAAWAARYGEAPRPSRPAVTGLGETGAGPVRIAFLRIGVTWMDGWMDGWINKNPETTKYPGHYLRPFNIVYMSVRLLHELCRWGDIILSLSY